MKNVDAGQQWIIVHADLEREFVPGKYLVFK
jgi:hypothetical protein